VDLGLSTIEGGLRPGWQAGIRRIYDTDAMAGVILHNIEQGMTPDDIAAALTFFQSPLGNQIIALETSARTAMTDPVIEDLAR